MIYLRVYKLMQNILLMTLQYSSVVNDVNTSCDELNNDLSHVNNWAFQWKISFNPDPDKTATEIIFFA